MKKLEDLPKPMLIFIVLTVGVLFIFVSNPPKNVCDVQSDIFRKSQEGFIFPQANSRSTSGSPLLKRTLGQCQEGNSAGACLEYFSTLRQFAKALKSVQTECFPTIIEIEEVEASVKSGIRVLAALAWGEEPPSLDATNRFGWLEMPELAVFCDLKNIFLKKFDEETWEEWQLQVIRGLPGANKLQAEDARSRSIFILRCEAIF